ncbi:hypothetical protein OJAV_G00012520 [Oryzias javanicus]|uniref:Sulfatase N-terminal domain-containing protein n=1 Tax=Oryzias javanicus TaxID=123683 RepID=A0A3S2PSK4_ORYJA|nr:hypothetical protein OJAV_G00012520 [Oryzias javanicus]
MSHSFQPSPMTRDRSVVEQPFRSENLTQSMTREAVAFMERNAARPFLLFFSFLQVHTAMFASAPFRGTSRHGIYGDAVHEVDWSVGQIMQTLGRLGLRENTLVYLSSDHRALTWRSCLQQVRSTEAPTASTKQGSPPAGKEGSGSLES